jgi:hypothetical protein
MLADPFLFARREQIVALATRYAIRAIYPVRWLPDVGGLMSYGASPVDLAHLMGTQTGKILKGAKPTDIPFQQSTKLKLVINLKTAKALGLTVPPSFARPRRRGDRVRGSLLQCSYVSSGSGAEKLIASICFPSYPK